MITKHCQKEIISIVRYLVNMQHNSEHKSIPVYPSMQNIAQLLHHPEHVHFSDPPSQQDSIKIYKTIYFETL